MMHKLNKPPPMDLPSERLIITLNISPSNNHFKPSLQILTENNAITEGYCVVGARKWVGQVPRSEICSKGFLNDLQNERNMPPLKNKLGKWCCGPPLQHPATQRYTAVEITLQLKEDAWPQARMWRISIQSPSRGLSRKEEEFINRNALC